MEPRADCVAAPAFGVRTFVSCQKVRIRESDSDFHASYPPLMSIKLHPMGGYAAKRD